jgi:hypothetical protein
MTVHIRSVKDQNFMSIIDKYVTFAESLSRILNK